MVLRNLNMTQNLGYVLTPAPKVSEDFRLGLLRIEAENAKYLAEEAEREAKYFAEKAEREAKV
tara:strand:- start:324 stop:512 length:189 start_codon:yes stop_codon:yes gene_type:complete